MYSTICGARVAAPADPEQFFGALESRLLSCMRRVLVIGIEIPTGASSVFVSVDSFTHAHLFDDVDAVVAATSDQIAAALPYVAPHTAVFVAPPTHDVRPALVAGLLPYIEWPDMVMAVREDYDPVAHARRLLKARRPHEAYEILANIPNRLVQSMEAKASIAAEKQWCLLAISATADARSALNLFYRAQEQFFLATTYAPYFAPSYLCHARHWKRIGREDMASRLLKTCATFHSSDDVRVELDVLNPTAPPADEAAPPEFHDGPGSVRLLVISHEGSDYGLDTLYDGLCTVLGDDAVVEIPWKPTLHGREPERAEGYPCVYHRRGEPMSIPAVTGQLRDGLFDFVIFADTLKTLDPHGVRAVMDAAHDVPLIILDTWDEGGDYRADLLQFLGRDQCLAYFKREMLAGLDYGRASYPLPFGYSESNIPKLTDVPRTHEVFWAGKPAAGLRPVYLDRLRAKGIDIDRKYSQHEYRNMLLRARIGLNLFGYGFDTVRYWEVPAHGAMLLSERPPIRIPHQFRDGVHAVYFDDLPDLEDKLKHFMRRPEEAAAIASAGHQHFLRHHTAATRARQFLGRVMELTGRLDG